MYSVHNNSGVQERDKLNMKILILASGLNCYQNRGEKGGLRQYILHHYDIPSGEFESKLGMVGNYGNAMDPLQGNIPYF